MSELEPKAVTTAQAVPPSEPIVGRTVGDVVMAALTTWRLSLALVGGILGMFLIVHLSAEPGTTIKFFGLEYQKAKRPLPQPVADETDTYLLPKDAVLVAGRSAVPILGGTLAVRKRTYGANLLIGEAVPTIRVAARGLDGTTASLHQLRGEELWFFNCALSCSHTRVVTYRP